MVSCCLLIEESLLQCLLFIGLPKPSVPGSRRVLGKRRRRLQRGVYAHSTDSVS